MSNLIEQDSDVALLHRGTRRFLLVGALAAVLIVSAIFLRQGMFRQTATLNFVTASALDINEGQSVKIAGFRVGSVEAVTLRADGQVEVRLEIDTDYMRFVTRDAVIELRKEGLVGSAILEIIPGPDKTRLAASETKLPFVRADTLTAMALSLRDKVMPILGDIKAITGTLGDPRTGLPATLAQVRETTASLNTLLQTGNQQVGDVGQAATGVLSKAEQSLVRLDETLDTVKTRLPALLDKTQRIVDHVEKVTADAETSVPPMLRDGGEAAAGAREIINGAKSVSPIKNWVDPPPSQKLKADSDPRAEVVRGVR